MESVKDIQKILEKAKLDAIKLVKELSEMVDALEPLGLADTILNDTEFKKYAAVLGKSSPVRKAKSIKVAIKPKTKATRATRHSKVTDDDIIKYLATEHTVGEIRKTLGQLVPKRLAGLEKAGKLALREDGLKKFWKAK
jgi:hypothetical protein